MSSAASAPEKAHPRSLPQPLTNILAGLTGLGVVAFIVGLVSNPEGTWLAFHSNFIFTTMMSLAGLVLSCIYVTVGAKWCGPYKRFAEGFAAWVPIAFLLFIVAIVLGSGHYLFEWIENPYPKKAGWLNTTRVYGTDLAILGILAALAFFYLKASNRPLVKNLADHGTGWGQKMAQSWTSGWKGDEEERAISASMTTKIAPVILLLFGIGGSLFAFDQVMSMEQMWFSNLFGAYVCWGGVLSAVAGSVLAGISHRGQPGFDDEITENRMHDIAKMLFAFCIFWMYLFFSQYIVIYYGNLPEETFFLRDRLGPQFMIDKGYTAYDFARSWDLWDFDWSRLTVGYGWVSMFVWACCWIIPFWVLLGARPKKTPWIAGPVATIVLIGLWTERNLLIWPSVVKDDMTAFLGLIPLGIGVGFISAFILVFLIYSRVFPSIAVTEKA